VERHRSGDTGSMFLLVAPAVLIVADLLLVRIL
jgi:hypothetical protein